MINNIDLMNGLIANFMGKKITTNEIEAAFSDDIWHFQELRYHLSFDHLMPVCKKLDNIYEEYSFLRYDKEYIRYSDMLDSSITENYDIHDVFPVVVEFIIFLNTKIKLKK